MQKACRYQKISFNVAKKFENFKNDLFAKLAIKGQIGSETYDITTFNETGISF